MPYKIVKTFEKGNSKLSAVPSNWEKDGVLHWPRYNENKLRRVESSYPEYNWRKINCKVKRSNLRTILEAEQELDKMCKKSDTETDTDEQYYVTNQKEMMFSQVVQDCIMANRKFMDAHRAAAQKRLGVFNQDSAELERSLRGMMVTVQPPAIPMPVATRGLGFTAVAEYGRLTSAWNLETLQVICTIYQYYRVNVLVLAKLETLQENYKSLNEKITENIKAQQDERKFINESVQSILLGLSNISVQFEHVMNQFSRAENNKQKANNTTNKLQTITSEHELHNFEKLLENPEMEEEWKNNFSIVCGKGKGRGVNNAYALVDSMFSRCFLLQCSWAGGSRTSDQKILFKSHTKIINFFFGLIHESDRSLSLLDCHKFFKNILKNSRQRNESKQERTSRTKNRPIIKANRKHLCNGTQPSLPITGTSSPGNSSEVSLPAVGTSGSGSENRSGCSERVVEKSGPDNDDDDSMSSASVAGTH
ncbi:unnamed protein product [Arctia plantaginis]|uniref:DUF4806 domain-containing protein n=1 Tax=Arctia plantaginis TaxID=874455 RepID=A0A8S0YSY8_ARCPL|nr:unnamed protein product [Arctia plantaginis]